MEDSKSFGVGEQTGSLNGRSQAEGTAVFERGTLAKSGGFLNGRRAVPIGQKIGPQVEMCETEKFTLAVDQLVIGGNIVLQNQELRGKARTDQQQSNIMEQTRRKCPFGIDGRLALDQQIAQRSGRERMSIESGGGPFARDLYCPERFGDR